jgi:hypothetical protein
MKQYQILVAALLMLPTASLAQKYQDFPAATSVTATDLFLVAQGATYTSRKATATQVGTFVNGMLVAPPPIGSTTPNTGKFTTLQATTITGSTQCLHVDTTGLITGTGSDCGTGGGGGTAGNPTAIASDVAKNGSATTYMRSDAAPAVQLASSAQFGLMKCDGSTVLCPGGVVQSGGMVVAGTTQTVTAAQWNAGTTFVVTTAGQTITLPTTNTLSGNGGIAIQTIGQSATLAAASPINGGGTSTTIASGLTAYVTINAAATAINAAPITAGTGSGADPTQPNTFTGTQTFTSVKGTANTQSGTTYTLAATDCGKTVVFTSATAVTVTIPSSIVPAVGTTCSIAILQSAAGQVAVNGTAVTAATLVSAHSYTKTFGVNAMIGLTLTTIGATATAVLSGDGA